MILREESVLEAKPTYPLKVSGLGPALNCIVRVHAKKKKNGWQRLLSLPSLSIAFRPFLLQVDRSAWNEVVTRINVMNVS